MEAQKQTQMFTGIVKKVKCEAAEEQSLDVEDRLTFSQLLVSGKNPIDSSPKIVSDNPTRSQGYKRGREMVDNFPDHFSDQPQVMSRAAEVQASLAPEFPSFRKLMKRSHVTRGFWLGLPSDFCQLHLPSYDAEVILEDERGEEYSTNYLKEKALSGGWRGFSIAQKLVEGDVVVFHLICRVSPIKFKVYIVRARDVEVADGVSLPNSIVYAKEKGFEKIEESEKGSRLELEDESPLDWINVHSSNTTKGSTSSRLVPDIKDFNIVVNGITVDSLPTHVLTKYYHLCCNQKSKIHEGLYNSNIAAGIISETVNIVDAIRASHISTSPDDLVKMDKTLEAFGLLGMNVQFLRNRLSRLLILSLESIEGTKRCAEASTQRELVQREIKSLEFELLGMKQQRRRLDDEIEDLKNKAHENERSFQREATAPW